MSDLIVVSAITERRHMIDEYEDQLAAAGIDFHLENIVLPNGIASITARWRLMFLHRMCERFMGYDRIVFTDGWDVLFYGNKADVMAKIPARPMVSAERNCWPEPYLAGKIPATSPWPYVNAGMLSGSPDLILEWISGAEKTDDLGMMDQAWFNRRLAAGDYPVNLDFNTSLFYTVSYDREDASLRLKGGELWNAFYGSYPQFFHFAGPCSSVPFRAMLRGATDCLCA